MQFLPPLRHATLPLIFAAFLGAFPAEAAEDNYVDLNKIIRSLAPIEYLQEHSGKRPPRTIDLDIRFKLNSAKLLPEARRQLETLAKALDSDALKASRFRIAGHTDATGTNAYNLKLSLQRAKSVTDHLTRKFGIAPSRLETEGYGEERLKNTLVPTAAENRRVEATLIQPPPKAEKPPATDKDDPAVGKDGEVKITW
jgi:outer membrane protein OmpA-like peptidoglycan-associated protein